MNSEISRNESQILKGLAILGIMLHNYCHWIGFTVKENEFSWQLGHANLMWQHIMDFDKYLLLDIFSFLGHYGVPIFVFLSGYGLVKKYGTLNEQIPSIGHFMLYNACKLWKLMLPAWLLFFLVAALLDGCSHVIPPRPLAHLLFVINLISNTEITPGPFWYFGLIMQLYLLYRLFMWNLSKQSLIILALGSVLMQSILLALGGDWAVKGLIYVRYNCVGSLLPFCMGIYAAKFGLWIPKRCWICAIGSLLTLILIFLGGYNCYTWLFVPVICVYFALLVFRILPSKVSQLLAWVGAISAAIFVIHPTWRALWLRISPYCTIYTALAGYVATTFVTAWIYIKILKHLPSYKL